MQITTKEINKNLESLPKELFEQVNDYIDFLKSKYGKIHAEDWAEDLSDHQMESLKQGLEDIGKGRTLNHSTAVKGIQDYINSKK
jgi:DNA replication initiation complex subunit (GINS family)